MTNTEQDFWLIDELITMDERDAAQQFLIMVFDPHGNLDEALWDKAVRLCAGSCTQTAFRSAFLEFVI